MCTKSEKFSISSLLKTDLLKLICFKHIYSHYTLLPTKTRQNKILCWSWIERVSNRYQL